MSHDSVKTLAYLGLSRKSSRAYGVKINGRRNDEGVCSRKAEVLLWLNSSTVLVAACSVSGSQVRTYRNVEWTILPYHSARYIRRGRHALSGSQRLRILPSNPTSILPAPQTDVDFYNHLGDLQSGFLLQENKQARQLRTSLPSFLFNRFLISALWF